MLWLMWVIEHTDRSFGEMCVVVLTLTRIIKSVITGQAPVTLELRNTPRKTHTQAKVVHAYVNNMGYGVRKARPVRCPTGCNVYGKCFFSC